MQLQPKNSRLILIVASLLLLVSYTQLSFAVSDLDKLQGFYYDLGLKHLSARPVEDPLTIEKEWNLINQAIDKNEVHGLSLDFNIIDKCPLILLDKICDLQPRGSNGLYFLEIINPPVQVFWARIYNRSLFQRLQSVRELRLVGINMCSYDDYVSEGIFSDIANNENLITLVFGAKMNSISAKAFGLLLQSKFIRTLDLAKSFAWHSFLMNMEEPCNYLEQNNVLETLILASDEHDLSELLPEILSQWGIRNNKSITTLKVGDVYSMNVVARKNLFKSILGNLHIRNIPGYGSPIASDFTNNLLPQAETLLLNINNLLAQLMGYTNPAILIYGEPIELLPLLNYDIQQVGEINRLRTMVNELRDLVLRMNFELPELAGRAWQQLTFLNLTGVSSVYPPFVTVQLFPPSIDEASLL